MIGVIIVTSPSETQETVLNYGEGVFLKSHLRDGMSLPRHGSNAKSSEYAPPKESYAIFQSHTSAGSTCATDAEDGLVTFQRSSAT